jgi:hypothetical protein
MIMRLWYLLTSLTLTFGLPQDFLRQSISKWDSHVQEAQKNNVQRGCKPQRRAQLPYNSTSKPKGVVLIFHGYTACPDAMENIADALLKAGYYSWIPLNPGHGRQLGSCATKASDCIEGVPAGFLPSNKKDCMINLPIVFLEYSHSALKIRYSIFRMGCRYVQGRS